jgi:hypothetical protein
LLHQKNGLERPLRFFDITDRDAIDASVDHGMVVAARIKGLRAKSGAFWVNWIVLPALLASSARSSVDKVLIRLPSPTGAASERPGPMAR